MTEQTWVINASPLILLGKINQLELAEQLASRLIVPQAVFNEITTGKQDQYTHTTLNWARPYTQPDVTVPVSILNWDIGAGESQVLAHCLLINGSKAVLDDGEARAAAQSHRIGLLGTLGIILRAKQAGLIPAAKPVIEQLLANGSYLSDSLVCEALGKVGEGSHEKIGAGKTAHLETCPFPLGPESMKPPIYHRLFGYNPGLLLNPQLAELEHGVTSIEQVRRKTATASVIQKYSSQAPLIV